MRRKVARVRLPLFPLPDVVHFPHTDLKLHIFEPRYRRLVQDLVEQEQTSRQVGMVLLKPGNERDSRGLPAVYSAGTAGRLVDVQYLPDGRSNIRLRGEYRFEIEREFGERPYRQAEVWPQEEAVVNEQEPGIVKVRRQLLELSGVLADEMGESFPLTAEELSDMETRPSFEEVINRLAADLDLPARRKLELLSHSLPTRAMSLLSILRSRRHVLDLLRPYRYLAAGVELN